MTRILPILISVCSLLAVGCFAAVIQSPRAASSVTTGYKPMALTVIPPPQFIIRWDNQDGVGLLIQSKTDLTSEEWMNRAWCGLGVTNISFPRTNSQEFFRAEAFFTD